MEKISWYIHYMFHSPHHDIKTLVLVFNILKFKAQIASSGNIESAYNIFPYFPHKQLLYAKKIYISSNNKPNKT